MNVRKPTSFFLVTILLCAFISVPSDTFAQGTDNDPNIVYDPSLYQAMKFRNVGPSRGGRVTSVAGVPGEPFTFYFGSTGGGVWRTTSAGEEWENITDDYFEAGSVGAIAIAASNRNVIYVGTGSSQPRGNISPGIGVYKSMDGGKTWSHIGLRDAGQIGSIQIHPRNSDLVYVAALGHIFGPNEERGIFRSADGGKTWEKVFYTSETTGAVDLSMDPNNPNVLLTAMWRADRKPWAMRSGGVESGIYKSIDGGDTWTQVERDLPELVGKIGVVVSPADSSRVYAIVEAPNNQGGLYRSDDGGDTFRFVNPDKDLQARPWYYMRVHADPKDANTLYVSNEGFLQSIDGGESFHRIRTPHGDHHALWINPDMPNVMIQGNDGGATVTFDRGKTWSTLYNQPTAEFYHVVVDEQHPYRLYGEQQDNSTITVPSINPGGLTPYENWYAVSGCETGCVFQRT